MSQRYCLILAFISFNLFSQTVKVSLEPFPPIINRDGTGKVIDLLEIIAQQSNLSFDIQLMTYGRGKKELAQGYLDLIGISPKSFENSDFYHYAKEINWYFNTTLDIFSKNKNGLKIENIKNGSIGTVIGNADFIAKVTNIPRKKFVEVTFLQQLAKMVYKDRLTSVVFERVAMVNTINRLGIPNIYYQKSKRFLLVLL